MVEYYPYQREAIDRMKSSYYFLLADEMGLGKTIQTLGFINEMPFKKILIVVPANLKNQWGLEIIKYYPEFSYKILGQGIEFDKANYTKITICSYQKLVRDVSLLNEFWDLVVLDEADNIRNSRATTSKTIKQLKSFRRLCLTGTPFHNRIQDLQSIFEFLNPNLLGNYFKFKDQYLVTKKIVMGNKSWEEITGYKNKEDLKYKIKPYMIRRTKKSVGLELPPVIHNSIVLDNDYVALGNLLRQLKIQLKETIRATKEETNPERYKEEISEISRLQGIYRTATNSITVLRASKFDIEGLDIPNEEESPKLDYIEQNIDKYLIDGEKVIIFSCFRRMIERIRTILEKKGITTFMYHGELEQKDKVETLAKFADHSGSSVMLSTDAGAFGLNLQFVSTIIHVDLPWDPAILCQRNARANRIGQKTPLQIVYLSLGDSFDQKINNVLISKATTAGSLIESSGEKIFSEIKDYL